MLWQMFSGLWGMDMQHWRHLVKQDVLLNSVYEQYRQIFVTPLTELLYTFRGTLQLITPGPNS